LELVQKLSDKIEKELVLPHPNLPTNHFKESLLQILFLLLCWFLQEIALLRDVLAFLSDGYLTLHQVVWRSCKIQQPLGKLLLASFQDMSVCLVASVSATHSAQSSLS